MSKKIIKKIDLSTAKVADGQLKASSSVYEMCGMNTNPYGTTSLETYTKRLAEMNLIELQDHAYKIGALATNDRSVLIDRLERKFLQEVSRFRATGQETGKGAAVAEQRETALRILSRGR